MQPGHQVSLATQILHSQKMPSPDRRKYPQPLNPPSIDDTSQINYPRQLSLLESNIQPTPTLPGQHRLLILHCACNHTTLETVLTTQHRLNAHKFNTIIGTR